ncbi:MAG: ABC transporter substrate-binding protein [Phycisphaera sp.]|nr:ABC transporter substrate-binding protein [Phycisphaera sp.]
MILTPTNLTLPIALLTVCVALIVGLAGGCATAQDGAAASADGKPTAKPFMFNEAKLPEGFPAPGPVGEIIVKHYPAYRAAFVASGEGHKGMNGMFRPLFNHIKKNDIAMTAPVRMSYAEASTDGDDTKGPASMAFYYRSTGLGKVGEDDGVRVEDRPAVTVVSIGVRGDYSDKRFHAALSKLEAWLDEHKAEYHRAGDALYLGYNSPFVPGFLKFSEVQLPIEAIGANKGGAATTPADATTSKEASR